LSTIIILSINKPVIAPPKIISKAIFVWPPIFFVSFTNSASENLGYLSRKKESRTQLDLLKAKKQKQILKR
jgi:hypothetical protein